MMVHIYLFFIASYVGLFLNIGFPNDRVTDSVSGARNVDNMEYMGNVVDGRFEDVEFVPEWASFGVSLFYDIKLKN